MDDPLSPLNAPPPRYLLESDSSDEEGQGAYPGSAASSSRRQTAQQSTPDVRVDVTTPLQNVEDIVLGIGQAGRYLAKRADSRTEIGLKLTLNGAVVGKGLKLGQNLLVILDEGDIPAEAVWTVVNKLIQAIQAKQWLVVSSYVPALYIPSKVEQKSGKLRGDPPIRYLSSSPAEKVQSAMRVDGVEKYDSPNYLSGVAAGIISLAAHPVSPFPNPPSALLLPLPLSALASSHLTKALEALLPTSSGLYNKRVSWTEDDDEPYAAPGMGKVRGLKRGVGEAAGMYT